MREPILELINVTKTIGNKTIVENLTFQVYPGEVFGFLGPNGAGKTTTIRMIMGMMSITGGEIRIKGKSITKQFEEAVAEVGGIVENPDFYPFLSGYHNLLHFARMSRKLSKAEMKERITQVAKLVGLENRIHDKVKRYSLGMKQRLGLAQALLHSPSLLVLDEPTNGLDPAGIRELRDHLRKLAHEHGIAIFVSSHLLSEMELMCDRIGVIQQGKLIDVRTLKEFVQEETSKILFKVKDHQAAKEVLGKHFADLPMEVVEEGIQLILQEEQIPSVIELLVKHQIALYGVIPIAKTLEEKFLEITEQVIV